MNSLRSKIYYGEVLHARVWPVQHSFRYKLYWYAFDLDELEEVSQRNPLFGYNKRRVVSIHDLDYLTEGPGSIREKLLTLLNKAGCGDNIARIDFITSARYFNYVFNPVSFYYCYRADGTIRCTVAEVNNTFSERHLYVLNHERSAAPGFLTHYTEKKSFHVSPFNDMQGDYDFYFSPVGENLDIRINIKRDGKDVFFASMRGRARPLTMRNQLSVLIKNPIMAALSIPRIYWQAARLHYQRKLPVITKPHPSSEWTIKTAPPTYWERICLNSVRRYLSSLDRGELIVTMPNGEIERYGKADHREAAHVILKNYALFPRLASAGGIGLGESYVAGEWETPDLARFLYLILDNNHVVPEEGFNWFKPVRWLLLWTHQMRRNSLKGSAKNISAHYDLSNDFFRLFLDPSMTYSSAIFGSPQESLEKAQARKIGRILEKLLPHKEDHILEIGSGWGALALEAASRYGSKVTSISLSREQLDVARARAIEQGLDSQVEFIFADYRIVNGQYDKIVSVEMLEAVGHKYLTDYFAALERLLKPSGIAVLQVIAFPDHQYEDYLKRQDWIQKYIFPGSHLPSLGALLSAMAKHSTLMVESIENIGPHYAPTLRQWRERFDQKKAEAEKLGFDLNFQRMWDYYLASCEAEFESRWLAVYQIVLTRPNNQELIERNRSHNSGKLLELPTERRESALRSSDSGS